MQLLGASAICVQPIVDALASCAFEGRVGLVWCDGEDVTAVIGDRGEDAGDVLKQAAKVLPFET